MQPSIKQHRLHFGPNRKRAIEGYLVILPWMAVFAVFTAGPLIAGLSLAFTKYDILSPPRWVGLANFWRLVGDDLVIETIKNTFVITIFSVVPRLLIALGLAILVNQRLRFVGAFRTIFYTPTIVPAFASAILWMLLMAKDAGTLNYFLGVVGLAKQGWLTDPSVSKGSIAIMTLFYFGPQMLIFLAALQAVPRELIEAATVDGASTFGCFWNVTVPMISPAIFFNLVVLLVETIQIFTPPFIATQGGPMNSTYTIVMYIYDQAFSNLRFGYSSVLSIMLLCVILCVTWLQFRFSKCVYYETG